STAAGGAGGGGAGARRAGLSRPPRAPLRLRPQQSTLPPPPPPSPASRPAPPATLAARLRNQNSLRQLPGNGPDRRGRLGRGATGAGEGASGGRERLLGVLAAGLPPSGSTIAHLTQITSFGRGRKRAGTVVWTGATFLPAQLGEADLHRQAAFWSRGDGEVGVVGGGDGADDRQAKAVVAVVGSGAVTGSLEGLEQPLDLRRWDNRPGASYR